MNPVERRRAKRKDVTLKGTFKIKDDLKYKLHIYKEPIDSTISDISALGCGLVTAYYLPKGLILFIKIKDFPVVSGRGAREVKDIEFTGRVAVCKTTPSRANKAGTVFVDIKKEDLNLIKKFVESSA